MEDVIIFVEKRWLCKYYLPHSLIHERNKYANKALAGHKSCSRSSAIQEALPTFGFQKELTESMQATEAPSQLHLAHVCPPQSRAEIAPGFLSPQPKPLLSPKSIGVEGDFFSPDSLQFIVLTKESSLLLPLGIHENTFLISSWARYTGFTI